MTKYQDGKIYCLRSYQTDNIYIGSTTQSLTQRLGKHKSNYKDHINNNYHYITSYELLKYEDCYIELIEGYPCSSKSELNKREGEVIRQTNNCVNKVIPKRTPKEYREDNREELNLKRVVFLANNRDRINLKKKEKITCECGTEINYGGMSGHVKTQKHEKLLKLKNSNEVDTIDIPTKKATDILTCECGDAITRGNIAAHKKTQRHQKNLNLKNSTEELSLAETQDIEEQS